MRLKSLDLFRGLTIAGMIIVNTPGNETAYPLLDHAEWNGCTLADLVFPFFLFIVGAAIPLSKKTSFSAQIKRAAVIFGLGLFLNAIPNYHPATLRIPGVLQRIAVCYLACAVAFRTLGTRALGALAAGLLFAYWALIHGDLTPDANLAARLDRLLLGRHLYHQGTFDPEGLLSTLPALATTILGALAGSWVSFARMALAGAVLAAAGLLWGHWFPFNKALWTGSYALWTGGLAMLVLAFCHRLADVEGRSVPALEALGVNAIAAYVLPILLLKGIVYNKIGAPPIQIRIWLCDHFFGGWLSPRNASLAFASCYLALWIGVFRALQRKGVFFKV